MFTWLLIFLFIRPFLSSLAFPYLNNIYSFLFLALLAAMVVSKGLLRKGLGWTGYALGLFSLALALSVVFSMDRGRSLFESYKYATGLLLFLVSASFTDLEGRRFIRIIVWSGLIISLLAIYQYFFGFQNLLGYVSREKITDTFTLDYIRQNRVFFPFVTPNTLGSFLAMLVPLALVLKKRVFFLFPLVIALLLTKSLGALLSLFAAVAAALYLSSANKKKAVFFLLGFAIPIASVFLWRSVFSEAHLRPGFSGLMRLNYWKETLEISWKHLLTGQGIGNFSLPLSRYAHNSYLQLLAETGIPGLSAFLLFLGSVAVAVKKATKLSNERYLIACVFCSSLAFLFDNLVDFSFFLPEVSLLWWGIMGLLYSMCRLDTSRKPDYLPEKP